MSAKRELENYMAFKFKIETAEEKKRKSLYKKYGFSALTILILFLVGYNFVFQVVLDTVGPKILIAKPFDGEVFNSKKLQITFTPVDESEIEYCKTFIGGRENKKFNATNNEVQNIDLELESDGTYDFLIKCRDNSVLKNIGRTKNLTFHIITPLIVEKIISGTSPELTGGLLILRTGTLKEDVGKEIINLLPRNSPATLKNETKTGHLSIGLWGKTHLNEQEIFIETDKGVKKVFLPEVNNVSSEVLFYISNDGSTYHSIKNHNYNIYTNGGLKLPDLTIDEALKPEHLARKAK